MEMQGLLPLSKACRCQSLVLSSFLFDDAFSEAGFGISVASAFSMGIKGFGLIKRVSCIRTICAYRRI